MLQKKQVNKDNYSFPSVNGAIARKMEKGKKFTVKVLGFEERDALDFNKKEVKHLLIVCEKRITLRFPITDFDKLDKGVEVSVLVDTFDNNGTPTKYLSYNGIVGSNANNSDEDEDETPKKATKKKRTADNFDDEDEE